MNDPTDHGAEPHRRAVTLDPGSLDHCRDLSDAIHAETGARIDPAAVADALRLIARRAGRWSASGPA